MRSLTLIGVILIVLGIAGFVFKRVTYPSETSKVNVGPLQVTTEQKRTVDIPDIASGAAVLAGIVLTIAGTQQRGRQPGA